MHVDLAVLVDVVVVAAGDVLDGGRFEAELVAFTDQAQEANLDLCACDGRPGAVHNHERKAMRPRQHFAQGQEDTDLRVGFRRSAGGKPARPVSAHLRPAPPVGFVAKSSGHATPATDWEGSGLSTLEV